MDTCGPNILVFHPKKSKAEEFADYIRGFGLTSVKAGATIEEAEKHLPQTEVILGWKFPTHILKHPIAKQVRWFQSMGAGVDDLVADTTIPDTIQLSRIVDQFGTYISEYVFTFLLHIVKDVSRMRSSQLERDWDPFISDTLEGKTIGVAGLGSIGSEIVRKARAFDMKVHGLSFSGKQASLVDVHYTPDHWGDFVKNVDYLVVILPLTEATRHIINRDLLLQMKPEACLINVGRGALMNEEDLASVMDSGHLRAAVLDVFENEPLPKDHAFWSMPNVYVTPHLSGPSTTKGVSAYFAENVKRFMNQEALHGLVNRERGY